MKKILIVILYILLFCNIGYAQNYTCLDANTSYFSTTITVSGSNIPITYNETCKFGCQNETGRCNPSPYDSSNFIIYLFLPIISFILLYLSTILKEEDWAMHLLLLIGALLFLIVPVGLLSNILPSPFSGLYLLLTVIVTIVIFYYILKIIVKAVNAMRGAKGG
jgi:hypothetical protein